MKFYSFGCSLVFGTDLSDSGTDQDWPTASTLTWPALLATKFGYKYCCMAGGGRGNLCILDRLLSTVQNDPESFFIIQWSFIDRFDYSDPSGHHFSQGNNDWKSILPNHNNDLAKTYYQDIHSEYRDKLVTLSYIMTAINELERFGCRYIMANIDDLLWCDKFHASTGMIQMQQYIKPYIRNFDGRNFLDWSRQNDFDISPTGHPLEQAHAAAADLMLPIIKDILHLDHNQ